MGQTRMDPREDPVQSSPHPLTPIAVTLPSLCACSHHPSDWLQPCVIPEAARKPVASHTSTVVHDGWQQVSGRNHALLC